MQNDIRYEDYLLMYYSESENEMVEDFIKECRVPFLDYMKYLLETGFRDVTNNLLSGLQIKRLPNRSDNQLVEGMLLLTIPEREKKLNDNQKNYYLCNAICAINTLERIFTTELHLSLSHPNTPEIVLHNYCHILKNILLDVDQLINEYNNHINNNWEYHANSQRTIHSLPLHQILRQRLYGQQSAHSFSDVEISDSISVIRQIIELRIRRAFGVIGFIEQSSNNIQPLGLAKIFEVLRKYGSDIEFPVNLSSLERIYKWANWYIHSGQYGYSWSPYFIEVFLTSFSLGKTENDGSWSFSNAIKTNRVIIGGFGDMCGRISDPEAMV